MKFEIKPEFKKSIQSFPIKYRKIVKDLSVYFIDIMEDCRKRHNAITREIIQLKNVYGKCWCLTKLLNVNYILKEIEVENEKEHKQTEFAKTLEIKILFSWDNDFVKFLMVEYSLVPANMPARLDDIETRRKSCEDFGCLNDYPIEKNITFIHHKFLEILEIIDHFDFPSFYPKRYFLGMRATNLLHSAEYYWKPMPIYNFDPRDDLFIKSACPDDQEIRKYFNKDESVLMVENDVQERCWFLSHFGVSEHLSGLYELKK